MYLDEEHFAPGGGREGPWCVSCKEAIVEGQRSTRVAFANDPAGEKGLSGDYHAACAKPYASLARALDMLSRFGQ